MKCPVPVTAKEKSGSIINVAGVNGTRAGLCGHYRSAAKAALIHLALCPAAELGETALLMATLHEELGATIRIECQFIQTDFLYARPSVAMGDQM